MGSFAAPVALPELLRPWAGAGLELLFLPGGLPEQALCLTGLAAAPGPVSEPAAEPTVDPASAQAAPQAQDWPAPWAGLAAKARTQPKVIVTYAGLAEDLAGSASPAWRRQLQSILGYLGWTQGAALFWPLFFAQGANPGPVFATDIFAQGVRHFAVRHIVCLGAEAADRALLLFPQEGKPPVTVHSAPAPAALVSLLPHELHRALAHLKNLALG